MYYTKIRVTAVLCLLTKPIGLFPIKLAGVLQNYVITQAFFKLEHVVFRLVF